MNPTELNTSVMVIFNQLLGQYSSSISGIQAGSIVLGKELFNAIALLSVALLGLKHLMRKNVDMVETHIELIRWLIYLNVFYLFITQYDQFLPLIIKSFQQAGSFLGARASGTYVVPSPTGIISNGFAIAWKLFILGLKQTLFLNLGATLVSLVAVVVILYCFGVIAVELLLIQIGSQIILAGGVFLLAFAGLQWTREYAERYVHTFFQVGLKMLFSYVLIGIGAGLTNGWAKTLDHIDPHLTFQYNFAIAMATFVFYMLCQKLPEQATVYFTGRFPMGFNTAPSLPSIIKDTFNVAKKAYANDIQFKAGLQGFAKANDAAMQAAKANLQSQGKTPSQQDIQQEAIRTLGEARKAMEQAQWGKVVDDTQGGQLAENILDATPPDSKTNIVGTS